jgi:hypothetical protein
MVTISSSPVLRIRMSSLAMDARRSCAWRSSAAPIAPPAMAPVAAPRTALRPWFSSLRGRAEEAAQHAAQDRAVAGAVGVGVGGVGHASRQRQRAGQGDRGKLGGNGHCLGPFACSFGRPHSAVCGRGTGGPVSLTGSIASRERRAGGKTLARKPADKSHAGFEGVAGPGQPAAVERRRFPGEDRAFDRQAPVIAAKPAGFAHRPVAGDQPGDRVAPHRRADGAHRPWVADGMRDLRIGGHVARGDASEAPPTP